MSSERNGDDAFFMFDKIVVTSQNTKHILDLEITMSIGARTKEVDKEIDTI